MSLRIDFAGYGVDVSSIKLHMQFPRIRLYTARVDIYAHAQLKEWFPQALFFEVDQRRVGLYGLHLAEPQRQVLEAFDTALEDDISSEIRDKFGPDQRRLIECLIKLTADYNDKMPLAQLFLENAHRYEFLVGQAYIRADLESFLQRFHGVSSVEIVVDSKRGYGIVYDENLEDLRPD